MAIGGSAYRQENYWVGVDLHNKVPGQWRCTQAQGKNWSEGYIQQLGVDVEEVYAPVAHMETVPFLFALAAQRGWEPYHLDVKSAFLNGEITEEVFMEQPVGFQIQGKEDMVYKFYKALYGLK